VADIKTDLCVIGGGSGGLSVAAGAVQMGADVVLLEGHKMGGDCLNFGCVPSKALIAAGKHAHAMTTGEKFGVTPVTPQVDYAAAKGHVANVIKGIEPHDSVERFEGLGVKVITEYGEFISPTQVKAGDTTITARRFVISTGSSPFVPPIPGLDTVPYYTNETIFDLMEQPEHLIIVGGGPIGMELAQAHVRLGSKVTVLEGVKALGKDDPELAAIALKRLRAEGIEIVEGALASQISGKAGAIEIATKDGPTYKGSHLTYIDPEMAQVGLTEEQAREQHGDKLTVVRFEYAENDRARSELATDGLIKVMVVKGRPVGASIVGAQAGELIQTWALAIANRVAAMVAPYPTMGEINKRAAGAYFTPSLFDNPKLKRFVKFVQKF